MKTLFPLFSMLLIALLSVGCNKDKDDDDGGSGGTGGANDDLEMILTWETEGIDLDLAMIDPTGGVAGSGFSFNSLATSSEDDLSGPGEERVSFDNNAPDGAYVVTVTIIDENVEASFSLRIESRDDGRTFNETLFDNTDMTDDETFIVNFTKDGRNISF